jgi:ATP-binding cassette, subfamily F, member 3
MDDYRQLVLSGELQPQPRSDKAQTAAPSRVDGRRAAAERRVALAPLRKKLESLEARMTKLAEAIGKIDGALADGSAFQKDPAKATELSKMRAEAAETLSSVEEEWLALSSEIETASA